MVCCSRNGSRILQNNSFWKQKIRRRINFTFPRIISACPHIVLKSESEHGFIIRHKTIIYFQFISFALNNLELIENHWNILLTFRAIIVRSRRYGKEAAIAYHRTVKYSILHNFIFININFKISSSYFHNVDGSKLILDAASFVLP